MTITLGTNLPSINSRSELNKTTFNLSDVMERLSTGVKINKASDDAAGLVISQNMEAVIRCSDQAMANIQTASSFLKIAEDGLISVGDHYQRINDLLENMANDTNDTTSRTAAVEEIIERLKEINRLADVTDFNGRKMLAGEKGDIIVQFGTDSSELSTLDISPAMANCHTSAGLGMGTDLPYYLTPGSKLKAPADPKHPETADYVIPTADGKWIDKNGDEVPEATVLNDYKIDGFDPSNANCRRYMEKVQQAVATISSCRGKIGAYENRMDSAYDSLTSRTTSLKAAKGIYVDTDIAEEASKLVNQQIMQQLNISMMSMANSLQQNALSLLG